MFVWEVSWKAIIKDSSSLQAMYASFWKYAVDSRKKQMVDQMQFWSDPAGLVLHYLRMGRQECGAREYALSRFTQLFKS